MNPILDLFQDTKAQDELSARDIKRMMRDALEMLPFLGDDVVPDLKRCLRDRDLQIQLWTVDLLEKVPMAYEKEALDLLERQLQVEQRRKQRDNDDLIARITAVVERLKPLVRPSIQHPHNPTLLNMFQHVQNMEIRGGYARYQVETDMLGDARKFLARSSDEIAPALQTCLQYDDTQVQIWAVRLCEHVWRKYRPDVIALLKQQLQAEEERSARHNSPLKNAIKNMLSKLGDNSMIETAKAQLAPDNDYHTRNQALIILGANVQKHRAILLQLALEDDDARIRQNAISQLSKISDDISLLEIYEVMYEDESPKIRSRAIRAAMNMGLKDPRIDALAVEALSDESEVMFEVVNGLERRNIPATVPKMMAMLGEIETADIWQVARGLRSQMAKFHNLPDDFQPIYDLLLNANDYPSADLFAGYAVNALRTMPDLSALPVLMIYAKRDSTYEGDPQQRPSFQVLLLMRNLRQHIAWSEYETALRPYMTSEDEDERLMVARIAIFAGEENGYPLLRRLRRSETSEIILEFIKKNLPSI